jgi:hypothetical protein
MPEKCWTCSNRLVAQRDRRTASLLKIVEKAAKLGKMTAPPRRQGRDASRLPLGRFYTTKTHNKPSRETTKLVDSVEFFNVQLRIHAIRQESP